MELPWALRGITTVVDRDTASRIGPFVLLGGLTGWMGWECVASPWWPYWSLALPPALGAVFLAGRRLDRARAGSVLDRAEHRHLWRVAAATAAALGWLATLAASSWTHALVGLGVTLAAPVAIFALLVADAQAFVRLLSHGTLAPGSHPYRAPPRVAVELRGSPDRARSILQNRITLGAWLLATACALTVHPLSKVSVERLRHAHALGELTAFFEAEAVVIARTYAKRHDAGLHHCPADGCYSTLVVADINGDGMEDIIIALRPDGCGYPAANHRFVAYDGASLSPLWCTEPIPDTPEFFELAQRQHALWDRPLSGCCDGVYTHSLYLAHPQAASARRLYYVLAGPIYRYELTILDAGTGGVIGVLP